jgi:hypothetical protein
MPELVHHTRLSTGEQVVSLAVRTERNAVQVAIGLANDSVIRVDYTNGVFKPVWAEVIRDVVPRVLSFDQETNDLLVCGLFDGQM